MTVTNSSKSLIRWSRIHILAAGMACFWPLISFGDSFSALVHADGGKFESKVLKAARQSLGQSALYGSWSDVVSWPLVAIHANLLPNGKVLAWDATPDDSDDDPHTTDSYTTRVTLWDPLTGTHVPTNNDTNSDLFCAGSAHLWDGRILFAGGDSGTNGSNGPLENTSIYDPETNTWRRVSNMATPRWYSSVAALANGEMLTFGGTYSPVPMAEVFQFNETWRPMSFNTPYEYPGDYQWMQATPEGNVISFGPQNTIATINTSAGGLWTTGPQRDDVDVRTYGSYAMFDIGKILVSGGANSLNSAVVIETATMQTTDTGSMNTGRTQHNLTILADGSVLATGGNSDGTYLISPDAGVYSPEIWSPDTGRWTVMNDMQINRQYHSTALLLPDGRVLSAGGGICGDCYAVGYEEQNAEIFSPPYLFSSGNTLAIRPTIGSGPTSMDYARNYQVTVESGSTIDKVHLIKLGAVTHSQNQDQRLVPLQFQSSGQNNSVLEIRSPESRDIAPPGHYLLFVVDSSGVPSIGEIIKVGQPLIDSGIPVNNSIRQNDTHTYSLESSAQDTSVIVELQGLQAGVELTVRSDVENVADLVSCTVRNEGSSTAQCDLPNRSATRWLIDVKGLASTPYKLIASSESNLSADYNYPLDAIDAVADRVSLEAWNYYTVTVPAGQSDLLINLSDLTADVDLYVRESERPSGTVDSGGFFRCASYRTERRGENCHIENAQGRTWVIGVYGFRAASYQLSTSAEFQSPQISTIGAGSTTFDIAANQWRYFSLPTTGMQSVITVQLNGLEADADLYLRNNQYPERSVEQWGDYDCASYAGSVSAEYCALANAGGDLYIGVYAHQATSARLTVGSSATGAEANADRADKGTILSFKNSSSEGGTSIDSGDYPNGEESIEDFVGGTNPVRTGGGGGVSWLLLLLLAVPGVFQRHALAIDR